MSAQAPSLPAKPEAKTLVEVVLLIKGRLSEETHETGKQDWAATKEDKVRLELEVASDLSSGCPT